ncbi:MAG: hypothetical protein ACP5NK_07975, partial [Thermoplasmata archaeon]
FHIDDLMSSHVDAKVNDKFEIWINKMYGLHGKLRQQEARFMITLEWYLISPRKVKSRLTWWIIFPTRLKNSP